ncbi:MAG TPA: hypothetical protein VF331_14890 [Polyangiales bacterium]
MTVAVIVSPEAQAPTTTIDASWRENRPAAPELFAQEFAETVATLQAVPGAGLRAQHTTVKGLRRIALRATRYHLYYVANETTLLVLAVWSSVRGRGPDLQRLLH